MGRPFRRAALDRYEPARAINSPNLLLGSDIDPNGLVGKHTFLHPVVAVTGIYPQVIAGWQGALPGIVHAESHRLIAALEDGPALGQRTSVGLERSRRKIAEPD